MERGGKGPDSLQARPENEIMWEPNKLRNPCGGKLYPQFYRVEYVFVESRCQSKRRQIVTTLNWRQLVLSKRRWGKQSIRLKLEALIKLIAGGGCQYAHSGAKLGSHMVLWPFAALHLLIYDTRATIRP